MIKNTLILLLVFVLPAIASNQSTATLSWSDTTRDVYIDGLPDHEAQVLACDNPKRMALLSPRLDLAVILNQDDQTVHTTFKELFRLSTDHTTATSDAGAPLQSAGSYTAIDANTFLFLLDGRPILFRPHTGARGEMTEQKLWETVPVWRYSMESYQPNAAAVTAIRAADKEAKVTIVLGTWCPDSKNYVPKLFKALRAAGNNRIKIEVLGIDNQFHNPIDAIQRLSLVNVPTVIVERDGREIGRIIETPVSATVEEDLAAILGGKTLSHNGRWDRGPVIAKGEYVYRDKAGREQGREQWEIFRTDEGGFLAHSRITQGEARTEVWHRVNKDTRPTFVEVTRRRGSSLSRTRYRLNERTMTARFRSNYAGVIDQNLDVPDRMGFFSPSVAAAGFEYKKAGVEKRITSYQSPFEIEQTVGQLSAVTFEDKGEESVKSPAGDSRSKKIIRKTGDGASTWWLHSEIGFPVRGEIGEMEFTLTSLELPNGSR